MKRFPAWTGSVKLWPRRVLTSRCGSQPIFSFDPFPDNKRLAVVRRTSSTDLVLIKILR